MSETSHTEIFRKLHLYRNKCCWLLASSNFDSVHWFAIDRCSFSLIWQPEVHPGDCWCFEGKKGFAVIKVTMVHGCLCVCVCVCAYFQVHLVWFVCVLSCPCRLLWPISHWSTFSRACLLMDRFIRLLITSVPLYVKIPVLLLWLLTPLSSPMAAVVKFLVSQSVCDFAKVQVGSIYFWHWNGSEHSCPCQQPTTS